MLLVGLLTLWSAQSLADAPPDADGARAFDWELGLWETHVQVRAPLDADAPWMEFNGSSDVKPLSGGRANYVDLALSGPEGAKIEGVSLRLYNPKTQQWSINYASMRSGEMTEPIYGSFVDGSGVFYGQDFVDGRMAMVRFVISDITETGAKFEQSYSGDGGKTWIANWIATDARRKKR